MISLRRFAATDGAFIAVLVLVAAVCAIVGVATPLGSYAGDTFFLLGNAYRVAQGQVPHVDFSSPWGPLIFLIEAAGLHLSGMRPSGLGYANAVFGPAIAVWAFFIARTRWSPAIGCVVGVYTILLIVPPFSIGGYPRDFTYAMIYNRYGYALLGIVLLECAGDVLSRDDRVRQGAGFALSSGAALGLLLFLKVSYAVVALALVAISLFAGSSGGARRLVTMLGSFGVVALLALSYLRFDLPDIVKDLTMAAHARVLAPPPVGLGAALCLENVGLVVLALLLRRFRAAFVALVTIAVGTVVLVTNQQLGGFPLDAYAALALVGTYAAATGKARKLPAGAALATAICVVPLCVDGVASLGAAVLHWPPQAGAAAVAMPERGTSLTFAPFIGNVKTETAGVEFVEDLNDGLNLLRSRLGKKEGVLTLDEFNPFDYILGLPTPRGGFAAAAYDYIFDDAYHPTPERYFGSAAYVMVPKFRKPAANRYRDDADELALMQIYGPVLRAQYTPVAETKHWVLWRRKTAQ